MSNAESVLSFWYGAWPYDESVAAQQTATWFTSDPKLDQEITDKFEALVIEHLNTTEMNIRFQSKSQLEEALATILLLDQFTRNIYRGSAKAFAGDEKALKLCLSLLDQNQIDSLPLHVAVFACMPLQHSESPEIQSVSIKTFEDLVALHGEAAHGFTNFAHKHKHIIDQFGRYPHRNQVLGRISTDEELAYLNTNGERFGQ